MIKDLFRTSIPKTKNIHGIEIKKLPLGAYLNAIDSIKNLPEMLLSKSFPGLTPNQVLTKFKKMDQDMLIEIAGNLLVAVPEQALRFIASLIGVEYERLRDDPDIGLNGIKDIVVEFWKINDMQKFFQRCAEGNKSEQPDEADEHWFQELIVVAGKIGISKRQLLEDYYYDEIPIIFEKYAELNNPKEKDEVVGWDQIGI